MPIRLVNDRAITAADTPPRGEGAPTERMPGRRFHLVIAVENVWTGDGRFFEPGCFTWRDLPLPLMGDDRNRPAHMEAMLIGSIDTIERRGNEIHGWGSYVQSTDPEVNRLIKLVDDGHLRGVSMDGDDAESVMLIPPEMQYDPDAEPVEQYDDDGNLIVSMEYPREVFTHVRIMGATALPFPAIAEAFIESVFEDAPVEDDADPMPAPAAVAAALSTVSGTTGWIVRARTLTAAGAAHAEAPAAPPIDAPLIPPSSFFDDLTLDGPTPFTVNASGELFGHLALWGQCHIGSPPGECITPPPSPSNYAGFHLGEIICLDGSRIACGKITMQTGHAGLELRARAATAHYDNTGTVVAHVRCGEDDHGIWVHGALMPGLTGVQLRTLMGSDLSGDWRAIDGHLELVAALAVNVPGFPKRRQAARAYCRREGGMVASLVASLPITETPPRSIPEPKAAAIADRIAASIGRSPKQRIAALAARVHGGPR